MNTAVKSWTITSPSDHVVSSGVFPKSKFKQFVINQMFRRLKKDNLAEIVPANNSTVIMQLKKEPIVQVAKKKEVLAFDTAPINAEKELLKYLGSIVIPAWAGIGLGSLALSLGASEPLATYIFWATFALPQLLYHLNNDLIANSADKMLNKGV